ncbi:MAG: Bax inhibitor-1/YccA family protein [Epsilonproteobacteria bacterium]|nr:Bax inhibitor-1/YccA family protein [Campylobacterota bacterium]
MGLYDRGYISTQQNAARVNEFIKQTYQLFAGSLLGGSVGAYIGMSFMPSSGFGFWGVVILEFVLLFGLQALKDKPGINLAVLFAFTFVSGLTISPLIAMFVSRGMGGVVAEAFLLTSIAFGSLSLFAMNTKRDFTTMSKILFITLIVVVVASLLNIFFHSSLLQLVIAIVSSVLFSFFILYDTQNIIQGNYSTPIEGAIALYLDFFNLFVSLLQILGMLGEEE